jgi:hypothetical protein
MFNKRLFSPPPPQKKPFEPKYNQFFHIKIGLAQYKMFTTNRHLTDFIELTDLTEIIKIYSSQYKVD